MIYLHLDHDKHWWYAILRREIVWSHEPGFDVHHGLQWIFKTKWKWAKILSNTLSVSVLAYNSATNEDFETFELDVEFAAWSSLESFPSVWEKNAHFCLSSPTNKKFLLLWNMIYRTNLPSKSYHSIQPNRQPFVSALKLLKLDYVNTITVCLKCALLIWHNE